MKLKSFGTAVMNDIRLLEERFNVKLPQDYVEFLLQYNGGDVTSSEHYGVYVKYLKEDIHIDILLGINTGNKDLDIETWTGEYQFDMNEGMLIIGHSYEHGFIVLNCSNENQCVSYWDHSHEFECSNDKSNNYFIADTFTDFINNII